MQIVGGKQGVLWEMCMWRIPFLKNVLFALAVVVVDLSSAISTVDNRTLLKKSDSKAT